MDTKTQAVWLVTQNLGCADALMQLVHVSIMYGMQSGCEVRQQQQWLFVPLARPGHDGFVATASAVQQQKQKEQWGLCAAVIVQPL